MVEHLFTGDIAIIGQKGGFPSPLLATIRAPDFLPDSFNGFFFETQWVYWLVAAGVAATMYYVGKSRADKRSMQAGHALGGMLFLWVLAAYVIDTPKERLYRAHQGLAAAAKTGEIDKIVGFLAADFHAPNLAIDNPQVIRDEIGSRLKTYGIRGSTITAYKSNLSGRAAFTTLTLITDTDMGGPIRSTWQLSWDDVPNEDWRVKEADLVKLGDETITSERVIPK